MEGRHKKWMTLYILKESKPVGVEEFVVGRLIPDEPVFSLWVTFTLKKRDIIISVIRSRVSEKAHKFGIEVTMSIGHAKQLDAKNVDTLWQDSIAKDTYQVLENFNPLEDRESLPAVCTKSTGHLIFDLKMNFTRKVIWVKNGHRSPDPETSSCTRAVSHENIHIVLMT